MELGTKIKDMVCRGMEIATAKDKTEEEEVKYTTTGHQASIRISIRSQGEEVESSKDSEIRKCK